MVEGYLDHVHGKYKSIFHNSHERKEIFQGWPKAVKCYPQVEVKERKTPFYWRRIQKDRRDFLTRQGNVYYVMKGVKINRKHSQNLKASRRIEGLFLILPKIVSKQIMAHDY